MTRPVRVSVRMYQVGFGDCFLVSFEYPEPLPDGRAERHMLVDFGRNRRPKQGGDMGEVADSIRERCAPRLDVVVVSHRHEDHLSGFAREDTGNAIEALDPLLVVRPWTEDPKLPADATGPALADPSTRYLAALSAAEAFAATTVESVKPFAATAAGGRLHALALDQLPNRRAIERLDRMAGPNGECGRYLRYGDRSGIEEVIPGVKVDVLGPPTPEQWPGVVRQRENDPEYWLRARALAAATGALAVREGAGAGSRAVSEPSAPARSAPAPGEVGPIRWLTERLRRHRLASLHRLVRDLDDALNNTSLILLIRTGRVSMLFGGDAQIENWQYALHHAPDHEEVGRRLARVGLYKVGHHGSRNATPRSLVALWGEPGREARALSALLSSREDVYGETPETRVPSARLLGALDERLDLYSTTDDRYAARPFVELRASTASGVFRPAPEP